MQDLIERSHERLWDQVTGNVKYVNFDDPDIEVAIREFERREPDYDDAAPDFEGRFGAFLEDLRSYQDHEWPKEYALMMLRNGVPVETTVYGVKVEILPIGGTDE